MWTVAGDIDHDPPYELNPVRFAIGVPHGRTTQRWTLGRQNSDVYLGCPEVPEAKLSLHASGICRVAFTKEAIDAGTVPTLPTGDRVFHKWRASSLPAEVYRVLMPAAAVTMLPEQRVGKKWDRVLYVRPPDGCRAVVASLWLSEERGQARPPAGVPYLWLASLSLDDGRWVELVLTAPSDGAPLEWLQQTVGEFFSAVAVSGGDLDENRPGHSFQIASDGVPFVAVFTPARLRDPDANGS